MRRTLNSLQALPFWSYKVRASILRRMGLDLGAGVVVDPGVHFSAGRVSIGERTYINVGCFLDASGEIAIGARCSIAHRVNIVTSTHEFGTADQRAGERIAKPVVISDGCWIGTGAVILPGITIASGCIIGAGALITKDTAPNGLYLGSPAVRARDLTAAELARAA